MVAAIQLAPKGTKIIQIPISFMSHMGRENAIAVEQIPGAGYRMSLATTVNLWNIYGHMKGKTYPTIKAFLDNATKGWKSWQEYTPLAVLTNSEETAIIKAALCRADIYPKRVRHYPGTVIITMDRPEKYEGEFLQIEILASEAFDAGPNTRNLYSGIHVFSQFQGEIAAGYERYRRCKR